MSMTSCAPVADSVNVPLAKLVKAIGYAADKHKHTRGADTAATPHINFLMAVLERLVKAGVSDERVLCAAVLKDQLEGNSKALSTYQELVSEFQRPVADLVKKVTEDCGQLLLDRRQAEVVAASSWDDDVAAIKLAAMTVTLQDLLTSPPRSWSNDRKRKYFLHARRVVDELANPNPTLKAQFERAYAKRPAA